MPGFEFNYTLYVLEAVFYICSVSDVAAHVRNSAGSMKLQITCFARPAIWASGQRGEAS